MKCVVNDETCPGPYAWGETCDDCCDYEADRFYSDLDDYDAANARYDPFWDE